MKLITCILLFCGTFYAGAASKCSANTNAILETSTSEGVLEMLVNRFDSVERKMLELQIELSEHREEVERNRVTIEKTFSDFLWAIHRLEQDVGRNISVLQDHSLVILDQQMSCANHDRLREKLLDHIPKQKNCVTPTPATKQPSSCKEVASNVSGVYLISVSNDSSPFKVYCEMEKFDGGWIVIQQRFDGSVDFNRDWVEYREGFGELNSEFWLGLEHIHQLTTDRNYELMVEVKDFEGNYGYARYNKFQVGSESEQYILKALGSYSGTAGDSLIQQKGRMFSTRDRDNDEGPRNWAVYCLGAWWYGVSDTYSNLNGQYNETNVYQSNFWYLFKSYRGMSFSRMMIHEI